MAREILRWFYGAACLILCGVFLVVGLRPFEFLPGNKVSWVKGGHGLRFKGPESGSDRDAGGMAFTPQPLVQGLPGQGRGLSIEILVRCNQEPKGYLPCLLVLCDRDKKAELTVGQWKTSLIVRRYGEGTFRGRNWQEIGLRDALPAGRLRLITITFDDAGSVIYLDGKPAKSTARFSPLRDGMGVEAHFLMLGNSPNAEAGWSGDLLGVALYDRAVTEAEIRKDSGAWVEAGGLRSRGERLLVHYRFAEGAGSRVADLSGKGNDLAIPNSPIFSRRILGPMVLDLGNKESVIQDVALNILGFVPFGFFLCLWLARSTSWSRGRTFVVAIAGGFFISLVIELTQGFIPVRDSSQVDLICNTLGAGMGGLPVWARAR